MLIPFFNNHFFILGYKTKQSTKVFIGNLSFIMRKMNNRPNPDFCIAVFRNPFSDMYMNRFHTFI